MEWSEIVANKDSMIRPLYSKNWVLNEIKKLMVAGDDYDIDDVDPVMSEFDGNLVIGRPIGEDDDESIMMFGLLSCGVYLDDQGLLDYVLHEQFKPLIDYGVFLPGTMESVAEISFDDAPKKEVLNVLSYVIGESLSDPAVQSKDKISTKDCKEHLLNTWNFNSMKRTKKVKFGLIEVREFENDNGEEATILSYNGRIICSYPHTSQDYE